MFRTAIKRLTPALLVLAVLLGGCFLKEKRQQSPAADTRETIAGTQAFQYTAAETEAVQKQKPTDSVETIAAGTVQAETVPEEMEAGISRYVLTFVGDCTLGSDTTCYYAPVGFVKTVGEDYEYPFRNVRDYFENDDFTFLNLEGPLSDGGNPNGQRYSFRGPSEFINILTQNSVEAVTLANNHAMDFGQTGYNSTVSLLSQAGIPFVERDSTCVITLEDGLTIGVYASTYSKVDKQDMISRISAMKAQGVNLIIYAAHWGVEGSFYRNYEQEELGHAAIEAGANIVYGSHPHVLQPIEEYGDGVIFYSLGNFSFGGNSAPKDLDTAIIQQEILVNADGGVSLGERTLIPCSVSSVPRINNFQPTPYENDSAEYERVLEKLNGTYSGPNLSID